MWPWFMGVQWIWRPERALDPFELESLMLVCHHVGAMAGTQVVSMSTQYI